jgi:hypothetical protein
MPLPANGANAKLGKGSLLLALWDANGDTNGFDFVGNCNSVEVAAEATNVELFSSTQAAAPLLDRARTRISYTITAVMNEFTMRNLEYFLAGERNDKTQNVGTATAITFTDVQTGRYYQLGARQVTNVVAVKIPGSVALVENTDYTLNTEFGLIKFLDSANLSDDDDVQVEFDNPALTIDQIRIAQSGTKYAHLLFLCDDANTQGNAAKDQLEIWKVDVSPEGGLQFVSDDYGQFTLTMAVIDDSANHPNDPFGTLDRVRA